MIRAAVQVIRVVSHRIACTRALVVLIVVLSRGRLAIGDDRVVATRAHQSQSPTPPLGGMASPAGSGLGLYRYVPGPLLFLLLAHPVRIDSARGPLRGVALSWGPCSHRPSGPCGRPSCGSTALRSHSPASTPLADDRPNGDRRQRSLPHLASSRSSGIRSGGRLHRAALALSGCSFSVSSPPSPPLPLTIVGPVSSVSLVASFTIVPAKSAMTVDYRMIVAWVVGILVWTVVVWGVTMVTVVVRTVRGDRRVSMIRSTEAVIAPDVLDRNAVSHGAMLTRLPLVSGAASILPPAWPVLRVRWCPS